MKVNKKILLFIVVVLGISVGIYFLSKTKYISFNFIPYILFVIIGFLSGFLYNNLLKKNIFGGIIGSLIIGILGAVIGHLAFNDILIILYKLSAWFIGLSENSPKINIIASILGSFIFLIILNKINPGDKNK